MLENFLSYPVLGIEVDSNKIKVVRIAVIKGKVKIQFHSTISLDRFDDFSVKPLYISEKQTLQEAFSESFSATAISASDILMRQLEIKLAKEKEVKAAIPFQVEPLLPFPIEDTIIEHVIIKKNSGSFLTNVLALKKELLKQHLENLEYIKLDPEGVSCSQVALAAFTETFSNIKASGKPTGIIHIGNRETLCVIAEDGLVLASHTIPLGVGSLVKTLAEENKISEEQAEELLKTLNISSAIEEFPQFNNTLQSLYQEIAKSLFALAKQSKSQHLGEILLTGKGSLLHSMPILLAQKLNAVISVPKPIGEESSQLLQEYALSIGLGLSFLTKKEPINFRKENFEYTNRWKRLKTPLMAYYMLSLLAAFSLYFLGNAWQGYQEDKIKEGYVELLYTMDKSYSSFEKELANKKMQGEVSEGEIASIHLLSPEEILFRLETLQKEIQNTPDIFPLHPNVPKASDFLAWLSTHPNVVMGKLGEKNGKPVLKIENLTYTLIKRPDQSKKQEKYQIRVELEFSAETPKLAREFHDALIKPNDMIAPKEEIKWNTAPNNRYRTSFILKDKTTYIAG